MNRTLFLSEYRLGPTGTHHPSKHSIMILRVTSLELKKSIESSFDILRRYLLKTGSIQL